MAHTGRAVGKAKTKQQAVARKEALSSARRQLIDESPMPVIALDLRPEALAPHLYFAKPYTPGDEKENE
jgi:hypothetical protein